MKNILAITLLVTGLAGNVFVYGQTREDSGQFQRPLARAELLSPPSILRIGDSVWTLGPDRMPCLVPAPAGIERMPVKKLDSKLVRPMPNGIRPNGPRVMVIPKKKME